MKNNKPFHPRDRILSFKYALQGLITFFRTQHNAWIHLVAAVIVVILGFIMKITTIEWCWLTFSIAFVFIAEMVNTALEFLTDLVSPEFHPLAGKVKDVAAAAVLLAAMAAAIIGGIIFIPRFL